VSLELRGARGVQLAVEVGVKNSGRASQLTNGLLRGVPLSPSAATSDRFSFSLARARLDMTVPIGSSVIVAISL
jgi:hypothetical protein